MRLRSGNASTHQDFEDRLESLLSLIAPIAVTWSYQVYSCIVFDTVMLRYGLFASAE